MYFLASISIILLLVFTEQTVGDDDKCLQYFKKNGYVPRFANTVKSSNLKVEFAGKNISCGSTATLVQTLKPPTLYYNAPSCCRNITVIGFFPDTPMFPPHLSWLINNIPPDNLRKGFTTPLKGNTKNNGNYVAEYITPKVPNGSIETKTIAIFVYCQCGYVNDKTFYGLPVNPKRNNFDLKGYAKKYRLGDPMAGYYLVSTAGVDLKNQTEGVVPKVAL